MSDYNAEILRATAAASEVSRWNHEPERTSFDIVGAILEHGIPIMCRPLRGLQGATVTIDEQTCGILLATWPLLSVQRFTLAHELGHVLLGHRNKFDTEVGQWIGRTPGASTVEEIAADTFASEVLAPRRRIAAISKQQGWGLKQLREPGVVYQLALRLGISFQATVNGLARNELVPRTVAAHLRDTTVQDLKRAIAGQDLSDSWGDVWELTLRDVGTHLEAGPTDLFRFRAEERASAGYLWEFERGPDVELIEQRKLPAFEYGASSTRDIRVRFGVPGNHSIRGSHKRPWNHEVLETLDVQVENWGKEREGLCRRMRLDAVEQVAA